MSKSPLAEILFTKTVAIVECPHCSGNMTVYLGDLNDITEGDVEAVKCPYCEKLSWIRDPVVDKDINEAYIEDGEFV
jgi:endogenous inhibitor of DNA gyrase (YacG/DUF329 family)